jgi:hypothetical protein
VFELQLMPALSQMVLEAAGMTQEQGMAFDAAGKPVYCNHGWSGGISYLLASVMAAIRWLFESDGAGSCWDDAGTRHVI